jgi:hypothetical protein
MGLRRIMSKFPLLPLAISLAMSLPVLACGSDSPGADASIAALDPTLDNIQEHIFDKACSARGCHSAASPAGDLNLSSADASFLSLVDIPVKNSVANQNGWVRVKPGDPELSFLVRKIGTPGLGEGAPMPFDAQLHPFYQDLVKDWIAAGAMR